MQDAGLCGGGGRRGDAAPAAFEREVRGGRETRIETADLLLALRGWRPTLDPDEVRDFREDAARFGRL